MKFYNEIIGLNESFSPYYRLNDEVESYWQEFIPTNQFYELLGRVLNSVDAGSIAERQSFWIHGTYGTGKSHATGVIKRLLYSPINEIEDYVSKFTRNDIKHRLLKFRDNNKVFPVVMYGASNITNQWDIVLEIEKAIRHSLEINNVDIDIKTEFETYIDKISGGNSINWKQIIEETPDLFEIVDTPEELIVKLSAQDKEILKALRSALSKKDITINVKDISTWIIDVLEALKEKDIANKIIIYWDEFTSVMDSVHTGIMNQIQKLAEMTQKDDFFLYIISHRTQRQGETKDDRKHLLGRFEDINYQMSGITTYHLISHYIQKKDTETWQSLKDENNIIEDVISRICEVEDANAEVKENIGNLFPIHPYTAYMSSLIAREIGSTERSIFKFLNDDEKGFRYFINTQPDENRTFLTPEYVFDFFIKDFEEEGNPFYATVLSRYKYEEKRVIKEDLDYLVFFKSLLLLNIVHRILNVGTDNNELVIPNQENLKYMFTGSSLFNKIDEFLLYVQKNKIIYKDHEDRYIVETSSLDPAEVTAAKKTIENKYNNIEKIFDTDQKKKLFKYWLNNHKRKDVTEIELLDCDVEQHNIYRKIAKFNKDYSIKILAFIARDHSSIRSIEDKINLLEGENASNIIFVVLNTIFTSEEYDEFIEQRAKAEVAHKRNFTEEENTYLKNAEKVIENWIFNVNSSGYIKWYLRDVNGRMHKNGDRFKDLSQTLNNDIAKIIFSESFDIYTNKMSTQTAWQESLAKKTAEVFLTSSSLNELISLAKGPANIAVGILNDLNDGYIVNEKLKIVNTDQSLPLNKMITKLDNRIKSGEDTNLADAFAFLFKPPFGFYKCHIFLATAGLLFRKYKGKLYHTSTGELLSENALKIMIEQIFQFHCDNHQNVKKFLSVRKGSQDEKNLVKLIQDIFEISECQSLTDMRHHLHKWVEINLGFPLWLYNYSKLEDEDLLIAIQTINDKILDNNSEYQNLSIIMLKAIYEEIEPLKYDLNKLIISTKKENKKEYFLAFFKNISDVQINEVDFDEIIKFLNNNLQEDQVFWSEEKIINMVKSWYIIKLRGGGVSDDSGIGGGIIPVPPINTFSGEVCINEGDSKRISKKIQAYKGDLIGVLLKLINNIPNISYELERILDEEEN